MTTPTFSYIPSYPARKTKQPKIRSAKFGDGYEQRQTAGINNSPNVYDLQFTRRTTTEADAIEAFLEARAGVNYFNWTPPNGTEGKYICKSWSRDLDFGNQETIICAFEQVFDP